MNTETNVKVSSEGDNVKVNISSNNKADLYDRQTKTVVDAVALALSRDGFVVTVGVIGGGNFTVRGERPTIAAQFFEKDVQIAKLSILTGLRQSLTGTLPVRDLGVRSRAAWALVREGFAAIESYSDGCLLLREVVK